MNNKWKKHTLLMALFWLATVVASGQQVQSITVPINEAKPVEAIFYCCKVVVTPSSAGQGRRGLTVELVNEDRDRFIMLFGHSFTEKDLKRHRPSIRFDKIYGTNSRQIEVCKGLREGEIMLVAPTRSDVLQYEVGNEDLLTLQMPVYLVKHREKKFFGKEKFLIMEHPEIILNITIESTSKTDEIFDRLNSEYDKLIEELEEKGLCPRRSHPVSIERQQEPYTERIENLKGEIFTLKRENRWSERDEQYKRFKDLKSLLEKIDFKDYQRWCGNCSSGSGRITPSSRHSCAYCNKSSDEVCRQMNTIYMKLDNGRTTKDEAVRQANALNAAWSKCPNFRANNNLNRAYNNILNHR